MWSRLDGETDEELIYRICSLKGSEGLESWQNIANILNEITGQEYTESKYRKQYQAFQKMLNGNQRLFVNDDSQFAELEVQKRELAKERQKLSDARVDYNRIIREEARKESYLELVQKTICEKIPAIKYERSKVRCNNDSDNDLIVHLTDLHVGIESKNFKNVFNENVFIDRMNDYVYQIIDIAHRHNSRNCYVIIGEIISGIIHNNLRLQNNLDMMEQFKLASEAISQMLVTLDNVFEDVYVYITEGNHSRISPKKEESLNGENMDLLLPFYLKARLQNFDNIHIEENEDPVDIARFNVRGNIVMSSHGDKDSISNVVQNFTMMFGVKPDLVYLGHRHTNEMHTVFDTKVIESGTIAGTDSYAIGIRKANRPEQTVSVVTSDGLQCLYDIKF